MNLFIISTLLFVISSTSMAQNLDPLTLNGINPGQPSIYPFLAPPPPPPPMGGPVHGPHGPGHVHVPHPEVPLELFRQTPRHGGPVHRGLPPPPPPPLGPYATGLRLPGDYPIGQPQYQLPPHYGQVGSIAPVSTSSVECSCSVSFGIQNTSSLVLPQSPQSVFPGVVCGPGSASLCRIQCIVQALNVSFDLMNQAVNPIDGNGVSLKQYICGNQTTDTVSDEPSGRLIKIKSDTSCSEQSPDYSATNKRTESIALGPQDCSAISGISSVPTIGSAAPNVPNPVPVN